MPDCDSNWLASLTEEDRLFIKRFVLASGSLKRMAAIYRISYPTVRLRLDRLIEKIKVIDDRAVTSDFERLIRIKHAEGLLDATTLAALLEAHRQALREEV